jgi:hypothetical protein
MLSGIMAVLTLDTGLRLGLLPPPRLIGEQPGQNRQKRKNDVIGLEDMREQPSKIKAGMIAHMRQSGACEQE